MRKLLSYIFCSLIIVLLSSSVGFSQKWNRKQKDVWSVVETNWSDWKFGNAGAVKASLHDSYQGWSNDQPFPMGKNEVTSMYEWMTANSEIQYFMLDPVRIVVMKDVAVVHYFFTFLSQRTDGDETINETMSGKNAETYIKKSRKWLLLGGMTILDDDDNDDNN